MKSEKLKIAIQNNGRLKKPSIKLLESLGLEFNSENGRSLIVPCQNTDIEILFIRHRDIPRFVQEGIIDFGIVGENVIFENNSLVQIVQKLGFGKCTLVIAIPKNSKIKSVTDLEGKRIATSYPKSLERFLNRKGVNASIFKINGSVEIAPSLNLADAICEITQTGKTLAEHNLVPLETVIESQAVLIESLAKKDNKIKFLQANLGISLDISS